LRIADFGSTQAISDSGLHILQPGLSRAGILADPQSTIRNPQSQ